MPLLGGLIGCGFVSRFHLEAWSRVAGARIVALCDTDPGRLEEAARRVPGARCYTSASQLFDSEQPLDFVEICTLPGPHRELVDLAARRRRACPLPEAGGVERADFLAMMDACEAAGVRLMIHENWRFRPWYRALRAELDRGSIGRPIRLRITHHDTRAIRPDGLAQQPYLATMPRLILMDMGCHLVDTSRYLMGELSTIAALIGRFGPNDGRRGRGHALDRF